MLVRFAPRLITPRVTTQLSCRLFATEVLKKIDPRLVQFHDADLAYASLSNVQLLRAWFVYWTCSFRFIVKNAELLYKMSLRTVGPRWTHRLLKHTLFNHFCAGEDETEISKRLDQLRSAGVGAILDYAAEAPLAEQHHNAQVNVEHDAEYDRNVSVFLRTIETAGRLVGSNPVAIKISGLASTDDLESISQYIEKSSFCESGSSVGLPSLADLNLPKDLEISAQKTIDRLEQLCVLGKKLKVPLMIDAEWLAVQPAIDYMIFLMMQRHNPKSTSSEITGNFSFMPVSTTYQCYLKRTPARIAMDLSIVGRLNFKIGVKLVRGAYMVSEREKAHKAHTSSPICENPEITSSQYHESMDMLARSPFVGSLLVASHNEESIKKGLSPEISSKLAYAQLLGMGDNLTFTLASVTRPVSGNSIKAFKYVPFGPVELVVPYLLRRAQENSALLGSAQVAKERSLINAAIKQRLAKITSRYV